MTEVLTDQSPDAPENRRLEMVAAVILGVASILTAFSAYKAALTDGDALKGYTASAVSTSESNGWFNEAVATATADRQLFLQYVLLRAEGQDQLAFDVRDRFFSPVLEAGVAEWELIPAGAPGEPPTALETEAYLAAFEAQIQAEALAEQAAAQFEEAQEFDDAGDKFELAVVFFAVSLFLAGIGSLFKDRKIQMAVLGLSAVVLLPGVVFILQGQSALP
jgi:hypothetical protein